MNAMRLQDNCSYSGLFLFYKMNMNNNYQQEWIRHPGTPFFDGLPWKGCRQHIDCASPHLSDRDSYFTGSKTTAVYAGEIFYCS